MGVNHLAGKRSINVVYESAKIDYDSLIFLMAMELVEQIDKGVDSKDYFKHWQEREKLRNGVA